jgi:hypothetical protein
MRIRQFAPLLALAALGLGACGGGGSADQAAKYNLLAGYTSLVTNGLSSNVTLSGNVVVAGASTPFTGTGTLNMAPSVTATFNGTTGISQAVDIAGSVTANGQSSNIGSSVVNYYSSGVLTMLGAATATEFEVAETAFNYPTTLTTSCSGTLGVLDRYSDNTMSVPMGTVRVTYSCSAPATTGGPLTVQFTDKIYDAVGALAETDVTTYTLTSTNVMAFVSATTQNASGNLSVTSP